MIIPRYARLADNWLLRGWRDVPCALVHSVAGSVQELGKDASYVLKACDGTVDFESMAFLPLHRDLLDVYARRGVVMESSVPCATDPAQPYRRAANSQLRGVQWAVTGRCNLRCRHCYMEAPSSRYGELPFDDVARLVQQFEAANVVSVALTGGEPFVRKDICELVGLLGQKKIRIRDIYTNGTVVTDRHLTAIAALPNRPIFRISFDGCGTHDGMRGTAGTEARVVEAIRRVRQAGLPVTVTTCIDSGNAHALAETYALMAQLDIHAWGIGRPQPTGEWRKSTTHLSIDALARLCEPVLGRWLADGRPFTLGLEGLYSAKGAKYEGSAPEKPAGDAGRMFVGSDYACEACREWAYVAADGTLLPCVAYEDARLDARLPNLRSMPLSEAWDHPSLRAFLDLTRGDVVAHNPECLACEHVGACGGGCRACGLAASGHVLGKDPVLCEMWRGGYRRHFRALADGGSLRSNSLRSNT